MAKQNLMSEGGPVSVFVGDARRGGGVGYGDPLGGPARLGTVGGEERFIAPSPRPQNDRLSSAGQLGIGPRTLPSGQGPRTSGSRRAVRGGHWSLVHAAWVSIVHAARLPGRARLCDPA